MSIFDMDNGGGKNTGGMDFSDFFQEMPGYICVNNCKVKLFLSQ